MGPAAGPAVTPVTRSDAALARAAGAIRTAAEPGWQKVADQVAAAVRTTARGGHPLLVDDPDPDHDRTTPGRLRVSDLVLRVELLRALSADPDYRVADLGLDVDGQAVTALRLDLGGRYGADLVAAAERARDRCAAVLVDVLGAGPGAAVPVVVTVIDVHH